MAGTGIHGYTGTSSDGKYNIVNGQIVSQNPTYNTPATTSGGYAIANRNGAVMDTASSGGFSVSDLSTLISNQVANALQQTTAAISNGGVSDKALSDYAKNISNIVSESNSDYADMVREILANQDANTAKSQAFAREQMDYQTRSDQAAMSWSAAEAQKNRDWQEKLSDQAHQREVKDLIAAGLNPILSANAGAFTGSGATGQGFSSSGAMGSVDTSGSGAIAGLMSTIMNTAMQAHVAELYTDAERYNTDLQYSSSRLATEASILNNQNSTSAQKWIATQEMMNDLKKTQMQGEYGLANTALSNEGAMARTELQEQSAYGRTLAHEIHEDARNHETNEYGLEGKKYGVDYGPWYTGGPWHKVAEESAKLIEAGSKKIKDYLNKNRGKADVNLLEGLEKLVGKSKTQSSMLRGIDWG